MKGFITVHLESNGNPVLVNCAHISQVYQQPVEGGSTHILVVDHITRLVETKESYGEVVSLIREAVR